MSKRRKASVLGCLKYVLWPSSFELSVRKTAQSRGGIADLLAYGPANTHVKNLSGLLGNLLIIAAFYVMFSAVGPWLLGSLYWPVAVIWGLGLLGYMAFAKPAKEQVPAASKFADAVGWSHYEIRKSKRHRDDDDDYDDENDEREQAEHKHNV